MIQKPVTCKGCPLYEKPIGKHWGFSRTDGAGNAGVLIVAEALGASEEEAGVPLVGKAGHFLFSNLGRVGLEREDFILSNVLQCRPPDNKLVGEWYESKAIEHCRGHLDNIILRARESSLVHSKAFVILTLGRTAFKRIMGYDDKNPIMRSDYRCYPHWSEPYKCWVIAADHPSFLMRGKTELIPVLQFAAKRAVEIAKNGLQYAEPVYSLDPPVHEFGSWIADYEYAYRQDPENTFLSYDIETPFKSGKDEEEVAKEDDDDYTILRCSFSYSPGRAVSVPWRAEYLPHLERLFGGPGAKVGWNNENYDAPRVSAQVSLNGDQIDSMLAWHVLNSALPKGLGFVTPFYAQDVPMWKHLSSAQPAFYNAKDADMALRNFLGIRKDLRDNGLWAVFEDHVIKLNRVLTYMSRKGVRRDEDMRKEAERTLSILLNDTQRGMEAAIPFEARQLKVYKKTPKITEGLVQVPRTIKAKFCIGCGQIDVKKAHFKSIGKKALKRGDLENPCFGLTSEQRDFEAQLWAKPLDFKLSNVAMQRYQAAVRHQAIVSIKEKKVTFDEKAIMRLQTKYKDDPLYPLILKFREVQKLLGTYIGITDENGRIKGGMPVGKDGRIHTLFTHNPSTLRSASQRPNLQNLPRVSKDPNALGNIVRNLIVAEEGSTFYARDYSGIEAVLVGYFAMAPQYIRLAKQDVHSFYTAWALHELEPGRIPANDLPISTWDDEKLFKRLAEIKKEFGSERNALYKHLVHGANFMQGPKGAAEKIYAETGKEFDTKLVARVMGVYFNLFPEIKKWHTSLLYQADKDGYLKNPFGYVHRFNAVYSWEKFGTKWQKTNGPDSNKVVAFLPQSTAAGIIKEAMMRIFFNHYEEVGQFMRLLVHDEIFFEVPDEKLHYVDKVVKEEMEKPILTMALPKAYNMGDYLRINTEEKVGKRWGSMK